MEVTERRIVSQAWFETGYSKTGWDSYGWRLDSGAYFDDWDVVEIIRSDKFGNAILGIAERKTKI